MAGVGTKEYVIIEFIRYSLPIADYNIHLYAENAFKVIYLSTYLKVDFIILQHYFRI